MDHDPAESVVAYYEHGFREADRATATALGRLEFERTVVLLRRHLPPAPARVLDVGGGTGVHAAWLKAAGYDVRLYDLAPAHVAVAGARVPAAVADARQLPEPDDSADVVLLLGPLYHLLEAQERRAALAEARRVAKPGGLLAAAAIGRYADVLWCGVDGRLDPATVAAVRRGLADGHHDAELGFTAVHLHTVAELREEIEAAAWSDVVVRAVEGATWPAVRALPPDADLTHHLRAADLLDDHPQTTAVSNHLLAFATGR